MKRKQIANIDITQPVEIEYNIPGLTDKFVVTGMYEDVEQYYKPVTNSKPRRTVLKDKAVNVLTEAQREATALAYDKLHGTKFYQQLKLQRQYKRNQRMAGRLGLV